MCKCILYLHNIFLFILIYPKIFQMNKYAQNKTNNNKNNNNSNNNKLF